MKLNSIYCRLLPLMSSLILCMVSCQGISFEEDEDESESRGSMEMKIRLTGLSPSSPDVYKPVATQGESRATSKDTDSPEHLLLAIYTKKGNLVDKIMIQDKSSAEEFGTFKKELEFGTYTILAIGWRGSQECIVGDGESIPSSLDSVSFSERWVPNSYICRQNIIVSDSYSDTRTLSLKRCVTKFLLMFAEDKVPDNIHDCVIEAKGIGWRMAQTSHYCKPEATYTRVISVNPTNTGITFYAFMPKEESEADIVITARDVDGNTLAKQTYENVPLKINRCTEFSEHFFTGTSENYIY